MTKSRNTRRAKYTKASAEGALAARNDKSLQSNPYPFHLAVHTYWLQAYCVEKGVMQEEVNEISPI